MRCLVTAGKQVNNTRAIARQLLGKRVPRQRICMQRPRYCWTVTMETMFSVYFVPKCYQQGQSSSGVRVVSTSVE
jgi:hypothetical protein